MNMRNASGFLLFGVVMSLLPMVAPAWFPPTGIDGTSARALWLQVMGVVQTTLGLVRMVWQLGVPAFVRWLTLVPSPSRSATIVAFAPQTAQRPADRAYRAYDVADAEAA